MKWFYLISFVAGSICTVLWTGLLIFVIATARYRGMGVRGPGRRDPEPITQERAQGLKRCEFQIEPLPACRACLLAVVEESPTAPTCE